MEPKGNFKEFLDVLKTKNEDKIKEVYRRNQYNVYVKIAYGQYLSRNNRIEEAKNIFLSLIDTKLACTAYYELGKLAKQEQLFLAARLYFEKSINAKIQNKSRYFAMIELAKEEFYSRNVYKSREILNKLIDSSDNDNLKYAAMIDLGDLECEVGNINKSISILNECLSLKPSLFQKNRCLFQLGKVYFRSGDLNKSRYYFKLCCDNPVDLKDYKYAISSLVLCDIKEEKYLEALKKTNEAIKKGIEIDIKIIIFLCKKFNVFIPGINFENKTFDYSANQIIDYDQFSAVEKIIEDKTSVGKLFNFNSDVDIYKLFKESKEFIKKENKIYRPIFNDVYIVPYENIGWFEEKFLKIETLPNSDKIVFISPTFNEGGFAIDNKDIPKNIYNKKLY